MQIENASAKLTLTLRMRDKRDDGFNNLEALTVFLPEVADSLETSSSGTPLLTVGNVDGTQSVLEADDTNLVVQAWKIFMHHEKIHNKYPILNETTFYLLKSIPTSAGLGGGSADAAATLRTLNDICGNVLSVSELAALGSSIGSDIAACVYSQALWMRGRGEHVELLEKSSREYFTDLSVLVITPDIECSTPDVFRRYEELGRPVDPGIASPEAIAELTGTLHNDLAIGAYDLFPHLGEFKAALETQLGQQCVLAGSGSTFFIVDVTDRIDHLYNKIKADEHFDDVRLSAVSTII